jgi:hypothetical protein
MVNVCFPGETTPLLTPRHGDSIFPMDCLQLGRVRLAFAVATVECVRTSSTPSAKAESEDLHSSPRVPKGYWGAFVFNALHKAVEEGDVECLSHVAAAGQTLWAVDVSLQAGPGLEAEEAEEAEEAGPSSTCCVNACIDRQGLTRRLEGCVGQLEQRSDQTTWSTLLFANKQAAVAARQFLELTGYLTRVWSPVGNLQECGELAGVWRPRPGTPCRAMSPPHVPYVRVNTATPQHLVNKAFYRKTLHV